MGYAAPLEDEAVAAQARGDHARAAQLFRDAIDLQPTRSTLHHNLALSLRALGQLEESIACFRAELVRDPDSPLTLACLGNALTALGRFDEAVACHTRAAELEPLSAETWSNLGLTYEASKRPDAALLCYRHAAKIGPTASVLHNLASALLRADRYLEAETVAEEALALDPTHVGALVNLGVAVRAQGRVDEAVQTLRYAVELSPSDADAHFNLGLGLLSLDRHAEGWREREWRVSIADVRPPPFTGPEPAWDGSPLAGRTLLLRSEQGLGDTVQFVRYARLVKALAGPAGGRVLLECQRPLLPLLRSARALDGVFARGTPLPPFDLQVPLLGIPALIAQDHPAPPGDVSYLTAEPSRVTRWRERLDADGPATLRVGINWQGNPRYAGDRRRSVPLARFVPLLRALQARGGRAYVLQKGHGREQLASLPADLDVVDLAPELDNDGAFLDTAAAAVVLDLVITSDTALPHVVGAVGAHVWMPVGIAPDWRWGVRGVQSLWYPTMRLFRQTRDGDWDSVFAEMTRALDPHFASSAAQEEHHP